MRATIGGTAVSAARAAGAMLSTSMSSSRRSVVTGIAPALEPPSRVGRSRVRVSAYDGVGGSPVSGAMAVAERADLMGRRSLVGSTTVGAM